MGQAAVRPPRIRFGPFELDPRSGELRKGPTRLKVADQSIEILRALLEQAGDLVTRDQLRERLWSSDTFVDYEHGLNAAVRRLREALGDSAEAPQYIETVPRRGYRFIGPVQRESLFVPPDSTEPLAMKSSSAVENDTLSASRANGSGHLSAAISRIGPARLVFVGAIVLALGLGLWIGRGDHKGASSALAAAARSVPVTSYPGVEADPSLSPDGNQVAFAWDEGGDNLDIFVKLLDAGEPVRLTTDAAAERAPVWSPDGRRIAFLRAVSGGTSVIVVPALGGPERTVTHTQVPLQSGQFRSNGLAWTPDGTSLIVVDRNTSGSSAIFSCMLASGERRALTRPPDGFTDAAPSVSPDGRYLAFVRRSAAHNLGNVFVQRLAGLEPVGEPQRLTDQNTTGTLDWAHDSGSVVYEVGGTGLWRIPTGGGEPQPILMNVRASRPSVARNGKRIVYQNTTTDANIWRMPGPAAWGRAEPSRMPEPIVASTLFDMSPRFSPDGRKLVFYSVRSGSGELWLSKSDGFQPMQLTNFGSGAFLGSPRWSPSPDSIAFDSMISGTWNIYVVGTADGRVRAVTSGTLPNVRPSWSRDGRWIYFASSRSSEWQIWKVAATGGSPIQITKKGGYEAFESPDGTTLYYARPPGTEGIWEVPVQSGDEKLLIDHGRQMGWSVTERGIALLDHLAKPQPIVEFFSFASRRIEAVHPLPAGVRLAPWPAPHFAVSPDGEWMLYVQYDHWGSDVHMLQGLW